jgi:threonine aldolase
MGILDANQIEKEIREANVHMPPTRLICLENTHNRGGGKVYPIEKIQAIHKLANQRGLKMHLDGARLFNASVASGVSPSDYAKYFDSVMFCFSKGLGAPVGSIVVGSKVFIERAHRFRKMLGGGMRQVGILAAAALYALENNVSKLVQDHENAKLLANELTKLKGFQIDPEQVETNIVVFDISKSGYSGAQVVEKLKQRGVLMIPFGATLVRAVTHLDVSREEMRRAIQIIHELFG